MSVVLKLDDELAGRLQSQAHSRELSLQQWALLILDNASQRPDRPETWTKMNSRRLDLIRQKYSSSLTDEENEELDQLQDATAKACEPADRRRLDHLKTFEKAAGISSPDQDG